MIRSSLSEQVVPTSFAEKNSESENLPENVESIS